MRGLGMMRQVIGFVSAMAVTSAIAAESKMTGPMLTETVPGSTIALDTPIGTKIPMTFGADGIVTGEAGILASYLGSAKDRGRWSVENHKLCIKWFRWFDSQPRCMEITIDGERITWRRDDGDTGTGTLVEVGKGRVTEKKVVAAKHAVAVKLAIATAATSTGAASPPAPAPVDPAPAAAAKAAPVQTPEMVVAPVATAPDEVAVAAATPLSTDMQMNAGGPVPEPTPADAPSIAVLNPASGAPPSSPADLSAAEAPAGPAAQPANPTLAAAAPVEAPPAETTPAAIPPAVSPPAKPRFSPARETATPSKSVTARAAVVASVAAKATTKPATKPAMALAKAVPPSPTFRVARVESDDMLNIRQGPSETHAAVGVISANGRGVRIVGACVGEWCPVKHGGVSGWVNRYYLVAE